MKVRTKCRAVRVVTLLWSAVLAPLFIYPVSIWSQTADEVEKRIASLPPDQRAWERFRFWATQLPPDQQRDPNLAKRYREYLKARGFSDDEADAQLKLVQAQGSRAEVERWNQVLTAENPTFNVKPNEFLMEMAKGRKLGTAVDVGMGQGRNTIWLAQQGWDVTGFDPAEKAVALAQETGRKLGVHFKSEVKGMEDFDFGERRWDMIVLSYVGGREMAAVFQRALKPGGVLVVEAFHRDATKGRSIGGAVVYDTGELPTLYPQLRVVRYEEPIATADFGREKVRLVRYCGERPE
jgi:2-polyprenyl-3-methyl-5-hydroxy-6-metoxy-1,4-benzoquinol methylase